MRLQPIGALVCRQPPVMLLSLALAALVTPTAASAHPMVQPAESPRGVTERYAIAVPSEKPLATVRLEVQFPRPLTVTELEAPPGWLVTTEKADTGQIVGAIWQGGSIPAGQFATFGVLAENPNDTTELVWSIIQTYEDGSEVQWTGPESAQFPAARTRIQSAATPGPSDVLAVAALVTAVAGMIIGLSAWRRGVSRPRGL
jgi:uncharacterized protein YcnI